MLYLLGYSVTLIIRLFYLLMILRFIFSWIDYSRGRGNYFYQPNAISRFINAVTDPIVSPFQGIFPSMSLDFSPIVVAMLVYFFIEPLIKRVLFGL